MGNIKLQPLDGKGGKLGDPIIVPYAPAELSFAKSVQYGEIAIPGLNQPLAQFVRGDAETISLELFFDSTDSGMDDEANSVSGDVEKLAKLVAVRDKLHRPPLVELSWGSDFPASSWGSGDQPQATFTAIVLSVGRKYTLFSPSGKPLRAVVTLALKRYATIEQQINEMNLQSADHTRLHIVTEGETLPLIAYDAYEDPAAWRLIADFNHLTDTRDLAIGQRLELPPRD